MKNKKILSMLSIATLAITMVGCGQKETNEPQTENTETIVESTEQSTEEIVESTESTETTEVVNDTNADLIDKYIKEELIDGILTIKVLNDENYEWVVYDYGCTNVTIETTEGEEYTSYVITGKEAGQASLDIIGTADDGQISLIMTVIVNEDLGVEYSREKIYTELEPVEEIVLEEDLDAIMQTALDGLGETVYRDSLDTRPINLEDTYELEYCLGVTSVTGLVSGEVTEPMMSSNAFSLIVLKFDTAENASAAKESLLETAPRQKWVCVEPEDIRTTVVNDNYVVFLMGSMDNVTAFDTINF